MQISTTFLILEGVPSIKWFGTEGDYNCLVMDLLGRSLLDLFISCGRKFSLKTVLLIADQMLQRLEFMHSRSLIHRNIKPENIVIGIGEKKVNEFICLIGICSVMSFVGLAYHLFD